MFDLYVGKNQLTLRQREPVTSGSVNVYTVQFTFSQEWDSLDRTAVFRCGDNSVSVLLDKSGTCSIPWEVLTDGGRRLEVGVCGTRGGKTVLPTAWASLGMVLTGVRIPPGNIPPTPELWEQALARKGDGLSYTDDGELGLYAGETLLSSVSGSGQAAGDEDVTQMLDEVFGTPRANQNMEE